MRLGGGTPQRLWPGLGARVIQRGGPVDAVVVEATRASDHGELWPPPDRALVRGARRLYALIPEASVSTGPFVVVGRGSMHPVHLFADLAELLVDERGVVVRALAPGISAREIQALLAARVAAHESHRDRGEGPSLVAPTLRIPSDVAEMTALRDGSRHALA